MTTDSRLRVIPTRLWLAIGIVLSVLVSVLTVTAPARAGSVFWSVS